MANIILNAGSGGSTLGTDLVAGVDYQIVKIGFSAAGAAPTQVSAANPLPAVVTGALPAGGNAIGSVGQSGAWTVTANAGSGTFAISAASLPLPTGAATDASVTGLQVAQGSATSGQKGGLTLGAVTTAAPAYTTTQSSPISLTTAGLLRVDGSGVTQPSNLTQLAGTAVDVNSGNKSAGTLRVVLATDQPSLTNAIPVAQSGTWTVTVSGTLTANQGTAAAGSGAWPVTITDTTNTVVKPGDSANNAIRVNVVAGAGSGGTAIADGATFTRGTTNETPAGGVAETSAPTLVNGKAAALSLDLAGNLRVVVSGGGGGGTSIVDGATFTRGTTVETPVGGVVDASAPSLTAGKAAALSLNTDGTLNVKVSNGIPSGTAGTPNAAVLSVQGIASMTPVQTTQALTTSGGASFANAIAPASPAAATIKGSAGNLYAVRAFNLNATPVYIKFFDTASAIVPGTTAANWQFMVPGNTGGAGVVTNLPLGRSFANSIKYMVAGAIALTDNTGITANSVIVDFDFN